MNLIDNGWRELPVTSEHAVATANLPLIHKDLFDRMLVAQANTENAILDPGDIRRNRRALSRGDTEGLASLLLRSRSCFAAAVKQGVAN